MPAIQVKRPANPIFRIKYLLQKHGRTYSSVPKPPPRHVASSDSLELATREQALKDARLALLDWRSENPHRAFPLRLKLAEAKAERQVAILRRRVRRKTDQDRPVSTHLWTVRNRDNTLLCSRLPTHKLLVLLETEEYHSWRNSFFAISAESQETRIRKFAASLKLEVAMTCQQQTERLRTATQLLGDYAIGAIPDPRRWRLYDKPTGATVHPLCIARAIGETPSHHGMTTAQMVDFMHKSGLDPKIPYRIKSPLELTFMRPIGQSQAAAH